MDASDGHSDMAAQDVAGCYEYVIKHAKDTLLHEQEMVTTRKAEGTVGSSPRDNRFTRWLVEAGVNVWTIRELLCVKSIMILEVTVVHRAEDSIPRVREQEISGISCCLWPIWFPLSCPTMNIEFIRS